MEKKIIITFRNGHRFALPASVIAHEIADWRATIDTDDDPSLDYQQVYDEEYTDVINEDTELQSWIDMNIDWSQIKDKVERLPEIEIDYDLSFSQATISIVDEEENFIQE